MIQRYPSALIRNAVATMLLAVSLCGASLIRVAISAEPAAASDLPADGIYPQGRKLAFAGYSGDPARDLAGGFTLAGPVYGNQQPYLERCFANNWPVIAHIGPSITFKNPPAETVTVGGEAEATTTSEQERQQREIEVPSWTTAEFVYDGCHWLWLINSANTPATFRLTGWPNQPRVRDVFTGKEIDVEAGSPWEVTLPAYGVMAIRWTERVER